MKHHDYMIHCPDCMALPAQFPSTCLGPLTMALRGQIDDPKCVVHCGLTVVAWGAGLWIDDDHPHPMESTGEVTKEAAAQELEKMQGMRAETDLKAFNWKLVAAMVLQLIQQLLNDM